MPLVTIPGLAGPSNTLNSINVDLEQALNFYPESASPGTPKAPMWLSPAPGTRPFAVSIDSPQRGLFELDGRAFGVSGETFFEMFDSGTLVEYTGTPVEDDADHTPVSFCSNGTAGGQLMFTAGLVAYCFDLNANTLSAIADLTGIECKMCAFMDGYGIVLVNDSRRFQISALEDFTSWDALDVAERSIASDNIVTLIRNHRDLLLLGSQTSESWYDSGDPLFPFQPSQGVLIEQGSSAAFGPVRCDNTLIFPVKDERGAGIVSRQDGYTNVRTTTYAIDALIQANIDLSGSVAFAMQMQGHLFYVLQIPGATTTLVYDVAEQLWHERAIWNSTTCQNEPHIAKYHCFAFGKHLVGSRLTGDIYHLDETYFDDQLVP